MTKGELWNEFMRTGKVSDYLKYKRASDYPRENFPDEEMSEEFYLNNPDPEEGQYESENGRNNNP